MTLMTIEEPAPAGERKSSLADHPLWRLGFRPFYLMAAAFAAVSVPLWICRYFGWIQALPNVDLNWHMHEMIFGFVIAVVIGFLFTAGRNWTGLWTPRRGHLAALAGLWLAGRLAMLVAPAALAAIVDLAFLPLATWPMYRVLQRSGNTRNLFLIGLLGMLTLANAVFHGAVLGWINISPVAAVQAAILIMVTLESVIAGRVIPGFTTNSVPGVKPIVDKKRDWIALGLVGLASIAWTLSLAAPIMAALAFAASCAQLLRLIGWKSYRTLQQPLLWILHLSYAWICIGFLLLGLAELHLVAPSAAFHALTVGSMAGLILGMMTRTTLGHTGRLLKAGRKELAMYALVQGGAVARVCASIDVLGMRDGALLVATVAWCSAFLLYLIVYAPYLCRARVDGREG
jgi:uncharacterized protein involved in response to NO